MYNFVHPVLFICLYPYNHITDMVKLIYQMSKANEDKNQKIQEEASSSSQLNIDATGRSSREQIYKSLNDLSHETDDSRYSMNRHCRSSKLKIQSPSTSDLKFRKRKSQRNSKSTKPARNTTFKIDSDSDNESKNYEDDEEMTLRDRQEIINKVHPFGIRLWKPALYKKSRSVTRNAKKALHSIPTSKHFITFGNILWLFLFGWWLSIAPLISGVFLKLVPGARLYSKVFYGLSWYIFWPFGKYVEKCTDVNTSEEERPLLNSSYEGRSTAGKIAFNVLLYGFVGPLMLVVSFVCWFLVFWVPMAKLNYALFRKMRRYPLKLHFHSGGHLNFSEENQDEPSLSNRNSKRISLCTNQACGIQYYKYTIDGINIIFINLLAVVAFVLIDAHIIGPYTKFKYVISNPEFIFFGCIFSTFPLAYFIGMSVSSISAQSSLGMGAVINATFGSIVEIILYCMALTKSKSVLVEGSLIGSFLSAMLLMPGLSMISGAFKKKEIKFNSKSAGVSTTMLIMSIIGAFAPTLFHQIYGTFQMKCIRCPTGLNKLDDFECTQCTYTEMDPEKSEFYQHNTRPFMYFCSALLPLAYVICLWFTLRTHTKLIYAPTQKKEANRNSALHALQNMYRKIIPLHALEQIFPHSSVPSEAQGSLHIPTDSNRNTITSLSDTELTSAGKSTAGNMNQQLLNIQIQKSPPSEPQNLESQSVYQNINPDLYFDHIRHDTLRKIETISDDDSDEEHGGHDAPEWPKIKSSVILFACTVLFALVAELMVESVDEVLKSFSIDEKFLGITLFAIVIFCYFDHF